MDEKRYGAPGPHHIGDALRAVDGAAIRVRQERCAQVRNRNVGCRRCAEACTSGCIALEGDRLVIDPALCVGCGTCATVCPTCALEAVNPSDAALAAACLAAARAEGADAAAGVSAGVGAGAEPAAGAGAAAEGVGVDAAGGPASGDVGAGRAVTIACSQVAAALEGLLDEGACATVVCAGRVDEALLASLAAAGVGRVTVACGRCERCAQRHGRATADLVAATTAVLLDAWGAALAVEVGDRVPVCALRPGVTSDQAAACLEEFFAQERSCPPLRAPRPAGEEPADPAPGTPSFLHVMRDGTLPHFVPDRRERLLDALASLGEPRVSSVDCRLWGTVVIDGTRCTSCRMCATFCPTGAIRRFDGEDGALGVDHHPGDCVKCGSCRDICPAGAITLRDEVGTAYLVGGGRHRYVMTPRPVSLDDNPHQILDTMRLNMAADIFER